MPSKARRGSSPAEEGSTGRQVIIIIVVIVVFAALLAIYLQLSGGAGEVITATATSAPAPADTAAAATAANTPVPSDTVAAAPSPTVPPKASDTPAVAPQATPEATVAAQVAETLVVEDIAAGDVSFATDVLPILEAHCTQCHGGSSPRAGISFESYEDVMATAAKKVVVPGDAAASELVQVVTTGKMPPRGEKLTTEQIQFISDWINAEAPNN